MDEFDELVGAGETGEDHSEEHADDEGETLESGGFEDSTEPVVEQSSDETEQDQAQTELESEETDDGAAVEGQEAESGLEEESGETDFFYSDHGVVLKTNSKEDVGAFVQNVTGFMDTLKQENSVLRNDYTQLVSRVEELTAENQKLRTTGQQQAGGASLDLSQVPDNYENPEGFKNWLNQYVSQAVTQAVGGNGGNGQAHQQTGQQQQQTYTGQFDASRSAAQHNDNELLYFKTANPGVTDDQLSGIFNAIKNSIDTTGRAFGVVQDSAGYMRIDGQQAIRSYYDQLYGKHERTKAAQSGVKKAKTSLQNAITNAPSSSGGQGEHSAGRALTLAEVAKKYGMESVEYENAKRAMEARTAKRVRETGGF